jgi:endonuclease III-like uncharacterized protein
MKGIIMTLNFTFYNLFEKLENISGLQRKDWEHNQSGTDRGLESVLIQRTTREVATYALVQLRFAAMPELSAMDNLLPSETKTSELLSWAKSQGPGGSMMIKVATSTPDTEDRRRIAALAVLKYYQKREDDNAAVKTAWTNNGLKRLPALDISSLLVYPTPGDFWRKKFETIQRLADIVMEMNLPNMSDDQVLWNLRNIKGVGPQTASMVALFWLARPTPIIDGYLTSLLVKHGLVLGTLDSSDTQGELRRHLILGAQEMATRNPDWPAHRSLSSLYLWACEIGRFHCTCGKYPSPNCPIQRLLNQSAN